MLLKWFNKHAERVVFEVELVAPDILRLYGSLAAFCLNHQHLRPEGSWWFGPPPRGLFRTPDEGHVQVHFDERLTSPARIKAQLCRIGILAVPRRSLELAAAGDDRFSSAPSAGR